ncbi:hypothetical protein ACP4OV_008595 [Aristida adscensionis]
MAVGAARLAFTWSCFFPGAAAALCAAAHASDTEHGRTAAAWTLLSSTLCFLCAGDLGNRALYAATFLSFVYAAGHLLLEHLVYRTVAAASLAAFGVLAVPSILWMLLRWNSHGHGHGPRDATKLP